MRTRIAAGLIAAAAVVGTPGLSTSQAVAATASDGQQQVVAKGGAGPQEGPAGWVLRDKYWQHGNCVAAGEEGKQRGHWDDYQCAIGTAQWVLWTNR